MMQETESRRSGSRWVSLGDACRLMGVNETTLRNWADGGVVRAFRTPGGHRRFLREDLLAAMQRAAESPSGRVMPSQTITSVTTRRIRRLLHGDRVESFPWYEEMDEAAKGRMRLFGRRLLDVTESLMERKRPSPQALDEVRVIGEEYGEVLTQRGLSLRELMEAFVFFRTPLTESVRSMARRRASDADALAQAWHSVETVADVVMIAMVDAYERSRNGNKGSA